MGTIRRELPHRPRRVHERHAQVRRLLVHPVAVGHGQRLFEDTPTHSFELVERVTLSTGVLNLSYRPAS